MDADEKLAHQLAIERQKAQLRVEETFPEADRCPACQAARQTSGDPTFLCDEHLRRIYGV